MEKSYKWVVAIAAVAIVCAVGSFARDYFNDKTFIDGFTPVDVENINLDDAVKTADSQREAYIIKININTATLEEFCELPSIGENTAKKIIDFRNAYGEFRNIQEIMRVSGIGEKTYAEISKYLTVE
ncbi:MAG: helix-hairpin-helix domain-containing protein [Clostridia bacterium]|nr:helix-hairpin-helix domain-containing protein [Clostridia bacterium]